MAQQKHGLYLLPNLMTTSALFAGFYAIIAAMNKQFEAAAIAIFIAMLLDGMDGRIARLTNTQSDFGVQYDSLSDLISFGLAPALVAYQWALFDLGKLGWLAAFVYAASTALRLARFNTQASSFDKRFFQGLPSPAAAAVLAGLIWLGTRYELIGNIAVTIICLVLCVSVGILMVSNVRYHSFKELDLKGRRPFMVGLIIVSIFVLVAIEPPLVLFLLALLYMLSGPVLTLLMLRKHREAKKVAIDEN